MDKAAFPGRQEGYGLLYIGKYHETNEDNLLGLRAESASYGPTYYRLEIGGEPFIHEDPLLVNYIRHYPEQCPPNSDSENPMHDYDAKDLQLVRVVMEVQPHTEPPIDLEGYYQWYEKKWGAPSPGWRRSTPRYYEYLNYLQEAHRRS